MRLGNRMQDFREKEALCLHLVCEKPRKLNHKVNKR